MIGTLINAAAIILGTLVGLLLRKGIPQRLQDSVGQGQGLCVILIGLTSAIKTADVTCCIICMVAGSLIGSWVEDGEYPNDTEALEKIVRGIAYENAKAYFNF